ncbi:MAG TPA: M23 family metallopeptidase [Terracidiphilus sp.]|jgi:murein DD-endopeptidase MepM/ murein hydrolase activator NlpD|nr:M23 family metallopeptidase [Terracidiphilus sp.]
MIFRSRRFLKSAVCILALLATASISQAQTRAHAAEARTDPAKNCFWQPDQLIQGSPMFLTCELTGAAARLSATWQGRHIDFFRSGKPRVWYALAGVDMDMQPGNYDLKLTALLRTGRRAGSVTSVTVNAANFGQGTADVPQQYVEPNPTEQREMERDDVLKKRAFASDIRLPLWSGNFVKPLDAPPTPSFGETRLLNEEKTSRHTGTDIPVKEGTPVRAANSGVVVLARSLYMEGNCIIVNHGQGFFTVYMHLSRIDVGEGARVRKDQRLGLSGATGRVTGPHLHFAARWSNAWVDPVQLLALTLPDLHPTPTRIRHSAHAR